MIYANTTYTAKCDYCYRTLAMDKPDVNTALQDLLGKGEFFYGGYNKIERFACYACIAKKHLRREAKQ